MHSLKQVLLHLSNPELLQNCVDMSLSRSGRVSLQELSQLLSRLDSEGICIDLLTRLVELLNGVDAVSDGEEAGKCWARAKGFFWKIADFAVSSDGVWRGGLGAPGSPDGFAVIGRYCSRMATAADEMKWTPAMHGCSKVLRSLDALEPRSPGPDLHAQVHRLSDDAKELFSLASSLKLEDPAIHGLVTNFKKLTTMIKEELIGVLRAPIQSMLQGLADEAVECFLPLKQKCKGSQKGLSWADGKVSAVSILQHAAGTLLKFPAAEL